MRLESALVVLIPEAESLVAAFRDRHDPAAALGVPAHVTTLYPFRPPEALLAEQIARLRELFLGFPSFTASFSETRRFPGVLYLAPEPAEPFRQLTEMVTRHFPDTPPYGGVFAEVIPHLTVAQVGDAQVLDQIAVDFHRAASGRLPIQARVQTVALIDNLTGPWQVRLEFALRSDSETG